MTRETTSFSYSLQNKGASEFIIDQDNKTLEIIINDQKVFSTIESEFERTIDNLRKNLDDHLTSIGMKEEIIYNISKYFQTSRPPISNNTQSKVLTNKSKSPLIAKDMQPSVWHDAVAEKYAVLREKVKDLMPELWKPLEFTLAVKSMLYIEDITLPFIGIILGPPSSVKTLTIELFRNCENTFYTDNFSAKSFVSHNTTIARDKLAECDLLPKMKDKLFLTPELSPTFSKRYEDLTEVLGIITRIADGHGYESDTGAQGHRGYSGEHMFTWVGAAVDVPQKVHRLLGTLGPKLYFLRLYNKKNLDEDNYLERMKNADRFKDIFNEIKNILIEYIQCFDNYTISLPTGSEKGQQTYNHKDAKLGTENSAIRVSWNHSKDKDAALRIIVRLARLLSRFRGVIPTWETKDTQGSDYAYTFATIEEPDRAITQLKNLARGHALSNGRFHITMEDIPLVVNVVLSTASRERVTIFDHILKNNGLTDTVRIVEDLNTSKPTALRTMTEFTALGIVDKIVLGNDYGDGESYLGSDRTNALVQVRLKPELDWFLSDEFQSLRDSHQRDNYPVHTENHKCKQSEYSNSLVGRHIQDHNNSIA